MTSACVRMCGVLFLSVVVARGVTEDRITFEGYQVVRVTVNSRRQWQHIQQFLSDFNEELDVWRWPAALTDQFEVMLKPSQISKWDEFCIRYKLRCSTPIPDVESLVELERVTSRTNALSHRSRRDTHPEDNVLHRLSGTYPTFEAIEDWLLDLNRTEEMVTVLNIGTTYEGRGLYLVKICVPGAPADRPAVYADTGMHSREWITQSSGVYIITQLVEGYYQNTKTRPLVEGLVWYIMPVVNPDGYVHSHTTDRFWRKNRAPPPRGVRDGYNSSVCIGVDLNRNWEYHWSENGVSTNSCSQIYPGHVAMSELETQAIARFILDHSSTIHAYLNIHSYGQLFLTRYGYTTDVPSDHEELAAVAARVANAMTSVHNVTYRSGRSPLILYAYSGGVADWAKGSAHIKFSYSTELRDRGTYGFVLPANYVIPAGQEIFEGISELGAHVLDRAKNISLSEGEVVTTTPTNVRTLLVTIKSDANCNIAHWLLTFLSSVVNIMTWKSDGLSFTERYSECV